MESLNCRYESYNYVFGHYKYLSAGMDFRRQNLTSKVHPRTGRANVGQASKMVSQHYPSIASTSYVHWDDRIVPVCFCIVFTHLTRAE